jgi:uncharacterized membrane protein YeaQ/YmgE (transglycosylase-associated protein family)
LYLLVTADLYYYSMNLLGLVLLGASIGIFVNVYQKYTTGRVADILLGALGALEGGYVTYFIFGSSVHPAIAFITAFVGALSLVGLQRVFANGALTPTSYTSS